MQLALNLPNPLAARQSLFTDHGKALTTSRAIAERFGKNHKDVLRTIDNLLSASPSPEFSQRNFAPSDYKNSRGKCLPEYILTHDGFAFLAMRFTGKDAMAWQIAFIQAFNAIESELLTRVEREAAALHQLRPLLAPIIAGTEQGLRRAAIGATVNRSAASISYHRRAARCLGLLPQLLDDDERGVQTLDTLGGPQEMAVAV